MMTMTITVWTPEDRATRDAMIEWCYTRGIIVLEQQIDERKRKFIFNIGAATETQWNLLVSAVTFYHEMIKYKKGDV